MDDQDGTTALGNEQREELTSHVTKITATTASININNNEPSSSRSVKSQKKSLRAPPTVVRSSVVSIQNDLSTMSLKNESISNLEEDLNPVKSCTHCTGAKVRQVHRFLDKINGRLIRNQQERKNTMKSLAKNIGIAKIKIQGRKLEEEEAEKELVELANKQKLLEKLLRVTMKNYRELFTKESNEHHPHRKKIAGDKFAPKLIKLPTGTSQPTSKATGEGLIKLAPRSVVNHPICRLVLDTIFKDVTSKSYRSYLFNKIICPAEKEVQDIFKATREPKIKRPRSHEASFTAADYDHHADHNHKRNLRLHTSHRERRKQTKGEAYSKRMVKTSRENNERHDPKSCSPDSEESSAEEEDTAIIEDAHVDDNAADHVLGSLPNSFHSFHDLARADRGFYHSVYNQVPRLETNASLRTFETPPGSNSGLEGMDIYVQNSDANLTENQLKGNTATSSPKCQRTTVEVKGPYSIITIHRNPDFDVDDKSSLDYEGNCEFLEIFLKKKRLEAERRNNAMKEAEPKANADAIDGDNKEALVSENCGKPGEEIKATAAEMEKVQGIMSGQISPTISLLSPPTTAVNYDDDSFEESGTTEEHSPLSPVETDHSEPEESVKESPVVKIMSSRGNLADVSTSASEEAVTAAHIQARMDQQQFCEDAAVGAMVEPMMRQIEPQPEVTVLDATVEVKLNPKEKLMQTQWGELVSRFNTPPSNHSQIKEHASTATLKFPTMKTGDRIQEQLKNIGLGSRPPRKEVKRPPSRLDKNRRSGSKRYPAPQLPPLTPAFKTLTLNESNLKVIDVLAPGPGPEPPSETVRRLNTQTAVLPLKRGTYRQLGSTLTPNKPPSTVVIAEPYRNRNSHLTQDHTRVTDRRVGLGPILKKFNKSYQSYKPAKISTYGLVKSIREFEIKNGLITPREQSAASTFDENSMRRKQNLVGLSTILKSSMTTNARTQAIHKQSKFPSPPTQRDIQNEVRRRLVANIAQEANSPFYTGTRNSVANTTTRRLQDAFIRKLPKPFVPASVPMPVLPPPDFGRRPRPPPLFKPPQNRHQLTLSALKSSRTVKPVTRKELPGHLRYGNFSYWLWPPVCARFPSPARAGSKAQRHLEVMQSRLAPNLNFTTTAGLRRYRLTKLETHRP